jgi:hypothetical protein
MEGMIRTARHPAVAGAAVGAGAVVMLAALVAAPGSWLTGYVSEAGTAGQRYAVAYRCGLLLLALGVALLGAALAEQPYLRPRLPRDPAATITTLLAAAALMAGASAVVPCSDGCPLPPFEPTTLADVLHTGAGIAGMALLAAAMLAVALCHARPAMRRLATAGALCTVPLAGALGLTMLFAGRGTLGAVLERVLLVVAVSWLIGTSVVALPAGTPAAERSAR